MIPSKSRAGSKPDSVVVPAGSRAERYAAGKSLRAARPRESHGVWKAPAQRRDAVDTVLTAEKGRLPELLLVESFGPAEMDIYAGWCGRALALSHARSGSPVTLSGYMGKSDVLDKAIASFSLAYADQNEKDHGALERAVRSGKVKAIFEEVK